MTLVISLVNRLLGRNRPPPPPPPDRGAWYEEIDAVVDRTVVTDPSLRDAIRATGLPWRVRDKGTNIEMVLIPPGEFVMGNPANRHTPDDLPAQKVKLTKAFYMGRCQVTQAQWTARMGSNPSKFQSASAEVPQAQVPQRPVEQVSWNTIQGFLSQTGMRLPTEAEWEYAYRAGTTTAFHGYTGHLSGTNEDNLLESIAWFDINSNSQTHPVGGKLCNGFGLHDMAGNVWEWVSDSYCNYYYHHGPDTLTDPMGPPAGANRVHRGGGYTAQSDNCRATSRCADFFLNHSTAGGFRVARTP